MDIYREENQDSFNDFILSSTLIKGNRRRILPTLPIHTISKELLLKILVRNKIPHDKIENIIQLVNREKEITKAIINNNILTDDIEELSEEEFNKSLQLIYLSNNFFSNKINYNYEEYLEHLKLTKEFAKNNDNYNINITKSHTFKNIQIYIHEKEFVMISKNGAPSVHFVIHHPKLRSAIENFVPPILE